MSIKLMAMIYAIPKDVLKAPAKSVLLALADNAWDDGSSCYPSRGLLAYKTNLSHDPIDRALREIKDALLIDKVGKTNMGVVEWKINVDEIERVGVVYKPDRPYRETVDPIPGDGVSHTVSRVQTISEPSIKDTVVSETEEPTYIPDSGDGPAEHLMLWDDILTYWRENFPGKTQPRTANPKLQAKVKARMKSPTFRADLGAAFAKAKKNSALMHDSWFQLEYLLRNDDNLLKVGAGEFDWKAGKAPEQVADPVAQENTGVISDKNFKPGPNSK